MTCAKGCLSVSPPCGFRADLSGGQSAKTLSAPHSDKARQCSSYRAQTLDPTEDAGKQVGQSRAQVRRIGSTEPNGNVESKTQWINENTGKL